MKVFQSSRKLRSSAEQSPSPSFGPYSRDIRDTSRTCLAADICETVKVSEFPLYVHENIGRHTSIRKILCALNACDSTRRSFIAGRIRVLLEYRQPTARRPSDMSIWMWETREWSLIYSLTDSNVSHFSNHSFLAFAQDCLENTAASSIWLLRFEFQPSWSLSINRWWSTRCAIWSSKWSTTIWISWFQACHSRFVPFHCSTHQRSAPLFK